MQKAVRPEQIETPAEDALEYHIEATSSLAARAPRVLKYGDAFAVLDADGDLGTRAATAEGIYFRDTRYLSRFEMRFRSQRALLLSSILYDDNSALTVDLTNPDIDRDLEHGFARDAIAISRTRFLWGSASYERIALRNYDRAARRFELNFVFDADFRDLFEVRGMDRMRRGKVSVAVEGPATVLYRYDGLDGVARFTSLAFDPPPRTLSAHRAGFDIELSAGERRAIVITARFSEGAPPEVAEPRGISFVSAYRRRKRERQHAVAEIATVASSNDVFNEIMCRSTGDIYMLLTRTPDGVYPYAGIPWYSTVFGRDGIITAMLMLWVDPAIARGVLMHLAAWQAKSTDPTADAAPGKILHERRLCEMARLGEVPFGAYYGTVDATPLFVMLAGLYYERTGDIATIRAIWDNIRAALAWCDEYGDRDRDGFVEYYRETPHGLANQGWKDSHDSVFHADGAPAEGPIALVEVQAYVYGAKLHAARLAEAMGEVKLAAGLRDQAASLRERFEATFWIEELGSYALALDGNKRACKVATSNAGHALFTGLASPERARRVASALLSRDSFSGWGVRTVARGEPRYNPMSYHNGSIWPHDNAIIAAGFGRYGLKREACRVFEGIFSAHAYQPDRRLPELFCGFSRKRGRGPTAYPVSCSPQAWAAATPFALLGTCLGIELPHAAQAIYFNDPALPDFVDELVIRNLRLGAGAIDARFSRRDGDIAVNVLRRSGSVGAIVRK